MSAICHVSESFVEHSFVSVHNTVVAAEDSDGGTGN